MTVGIYSLYWENLNLVYIGQSVDIEARYKKHLSKLKHSKHINYKLQKAYIMLGPPNLCIIEKCLEKELNNKEILWVAEFDSINNGLNIAEPGNQQVGYKNTNTKYSKLQILRVFRYSYLKSEIKKSVKDICSICNVPIHLVEAIRVGKSHLWLKSKYPKQYTWMQNISKNKVRILTSDISNSILISPNGEEVIVNSSLSDFCTKYMLDRSALSKVIRGKASHHKGWKLLNSTKR